MSPAFSRLYNGEIVSIGYQRVNCHMLFDVKMKYFWLKARLVAGGHVINPPSTITYISVVLKYTIRVALTLAALNDLPVKLVYIQNSYIMAHVTEKIWIFLGQKFGEYSGSKAIVVFALYGLNISGYAFWNHLVDCMHHLVFLPCPVDLDIWMKPMVRPDDGFKYYAYVLIYVDDVVVIHCDA